MWIFWFDSLIRISSYLETIYIYLYTTLEFIHIPLVFVIVIMSEDNWLNKLQQHTNLQRTTKHNWSSVSRPLLYFLTLFLLYFVARGFLFYLFFPVVLNIARIKLVVVVNNFWSHQFEKLINSLSWNGLTKQL